MIRDRPRPMRPKILLLKRHEYETIERHGLETLERHGQAGNTSAQEIRKYQINREI